jgi:nucleoside-diphosphate-sugar epimerase
VADGSAWEGLPDVDAIVHLAAETGTGQSMYEIDRYRRVNVGGTELAGRFAAAQGAPIVALASRAVYGEVCHNCAEHGVTFGATCCERAVAEGSRESDEHRPVSVYGETKSEAERALDTTADQVPVTTIRPQNVMGPGQALHNPYTGVLAALLAMLKASKPLTVYGGAPRRATSSTSMRRSHGAERGRSPAPDVVHPRRGRGLHRVVLGQAGRRCGCLGQGAGRAQGARAHLLSRRGGGRL